ncbi:MAG: hypothetical protein AAB490_03240 [Patescibacteria group bacterium]
MMKSHTDQPPNLIQKFFISLSVGISWVRLVTSDARDELFAPPFAQLSYLDASAVLTR